MTLRDLTDDEVLKLQKSCRKDYETWKDINTLPDAYDSLVWKAWGQAYTKGLKAYLAIQPNKES